MHILITVSDMKWAHTKIMCVVVVCLFECVRGGGRGAGGSIPLYKQQFAKEQ